MTQLESLPVWEAFFMLGFIRSKTIGSFSKTLMGKLYVFYL
ncbi:hypothetical protein FHS59_000941 [Algoriphagus iocasae]|uniref:Uncharacterized protein n=1 Tax=Algoriphagus iocasae TaxID=1836499 RepID=A0A841MM73_9BACT|nr:hypothetical protein [Algoriphagus iocasae]